MRSWSWGARASVLGLAATCVMLLGAWLDRALADRPPGAPPLAYSGTALIGGAPIADGSHTIGVTVFTRATGPTGAVCFAAPAAVETRSGRFSVTLSDPECGNAIQQGSELYVEVSVDGTTLAPRQRIGAVPYAIQAENGVPAGTIMAFGGVTPPAGWLVCDGRALDGAEPQYGALRAAIGTSWGTGTDDADAATDFNLPDLRGRFLRGLDTVESPATIRDEDRATRTASAPGGLTGANVGTLEGAATARPTTALVTSAQGSHTHPVGIAPDGAFTPGNLDFVTGGGATYRLAAGPFGIGPTGAAGEHTHAITGGGDAETRPENAAILYVIRL